MRQLLATFAILMASALTAHAQSIRLEEVIPTVSVEPSIDETLKLYNREYTCLIFAHSESEPCAEAMRNFRTIAEVIYRSCVIVVITGEDASESEAIAERLDIEDYVLAFDVDNRTLKAFGIYYVPFAVIYRNKNSRIEWFGPLHSFDEGIIEKLSNR